MEKRCPYKKHDCRHSQHFPDGFGGDIITCDYTKGHCDTEERDKLREADHRELMRAI